MPPSPQDLLTTVQGGTRSLPLLGGSLSLSSPSIPSPQSLLSTTQKSNPSPSFLSNLAGAAGGIIKNVASKVGSFFGTQASNVGAAVTGQVKLTPNDFLDGIKQTATGLGSGIESLAQGFNEGVARIAKSTLTATIGPEATAKIAASPIGDFAKVATGRQNAIDVAGVPQPASAGSPLLTYQDIYDKAHAYAINNNASIPEAKTFGSLTVLGMLFADNPLIGPEAAGGKGLFKLSEGAVKDLAKETSDDAIKGILKAENGALTEKELEVITPVFKTAANPEEVKAAAEQISKIQQAPLKTAEIPNDIPKPDEVLQRAQQNLEVPKAAAEIPKPEAAPYFRALPDETNQGVKFVPVDGQPVHLVDGVETFIHQTDNNVYEVMEAKTGRMIGSAGATPEEAFTSAQKALQDKSPQEIQAMIDKHPVAPREAAQAASDAAKAPLAAPQPFSRDIVRSIAKEDLPGPIADTLRGEFPALSDHALAPISERLAKLHRSGDIEGILQVVRNINSDIMRARAAAGTKGPIRISKETLGQSIAKVGERKEVGDLPASIGELLTSIERGKYLDNVSRVIKEPEQAVLAQQEYDALWEHADQRILDRYEELKVHRDIMRDILNTSVGKDLNALYKGSFLSPEDVGLDELMVQRPKLGIDTKVGELMMGQTQHGVVDTIAQGQKALEDWRGMRDDLAKIESDIRELRPKARAARILQTMVEDVPVISREHAGKIESLATFDDVRKYKDISGFMGQARDVYRNFQAVFGDKYSEVKRVILDPFDASKGKFADEVKGLGDRIEKNVIEKHGIERGSKESAAIQLYGEGKISHEELIARVGADRVDAIIDSAGWFRSEYNRLLQEVNKVRAEIFPNDPSKLIPFRKDYFRHFQEMSDGFRKLVDIFETPAGIDPQLAGLSEWTKPKSKFLSFAQERLGKDSTVDAVGGFLDYAPTFAYAKHIDPHIGNFRYLRRRLAESAPTPGMKEIVPAADEHAAAMGATDLVKQPGINNFLSYLDDFANDLAGKTNPMDRYLQKIVPGGRKTFHVVNWVNSRVKANTILGNLSSAIAQIFNVPNGIASAKLYSFPGLQRTLASIFTENEPMLASSFIKERYREDLASRFKIDWVDHPMRGTSERGKDIAIWITQAMDELGTKFIWNAHYAKALGEGTADPIKYADDLTREMVAGRGIGEVPLLQKSKITQLVAPFQVEVGNAWFVLSKFVKQKEFGSIATLLVANYLFNRAAEKIRGTPVVFDPLESLIDGATQASDEMQNDGNAGRAAFKFVGRQVGEILSNIPGGQTVAAAVPDSFVQSATQQITGAPMTKKELFGSADPGRFGGGLLSINGITDPLYRLFPPFGGMQAKRTVDGISSMLQGQVKDSKGNLSFNTNSTPLNVAQAVLFGKNATGQAQDFYNSRSDLFNRIYRQDAMRTQQGVEAEKIWADNKALLAAGKTDEALQNLQALDKSDPLLSTAVKQVAKDEAAGLSGTDRLVKMLGVENGERAKYITDTVRGLKSQDEKIAFLQNLDDKKLIPKQVFQQLQLLLPDALKQ